MANWDPGYVGEKVDWYREYVARHAPLSLSWLQQPDRGADFSNPKVEIRGMGLLKRDGTNIVVGPGEYGSVCLWDVGRDNDDSICNENGHQILASSELHLLSTHKLRGSSWEISPSDGPVGCVSVDSVRGKAYIAIHATLNEVDLTTLQVSSCDKYPHQISAISEGPHPTPLTIGTTQSLHIHDPRLNNSSYSDSFTYIADRTDNAFVRNANDFHRLHSGDSFRNEYAPVDPLPLSILHLPGTIYVAGRFPSILTYDRRRFPAITSSIHSGARLSSLSSLPSPSTPTLLAAGEYNGKGSLEIYPLSAPTPHIRNRTSASSSKIFSCHPHGTRLLFSDSDGMLKWVERDAKTLVRRWNINTYTTTTTITGASRPHTPPGGGGIFNAEVGGGDVARKLIPLGEGPTSRVCVWTGERVGVVGFGRSPRGGGEVEGEGEGEGEKWEERGFARMMRRALERQADEVRFVRGLGLGLGSGSGLRGDV